MASFIENLLGKEHSPKHIDVGHAHRLGGQAANGANRPRVLIARIHNYRTTVIHVTTDQVKFWTEMLWCEGTYLGVLETVVNPPKEYLS